MSVLSAFMCFLNAVNTMIIDGSTCFSLPHNASISTSMSFSSDIHDSSNYFAFWRVSESSLQQIQQHASTSLTALQRSSSYEATGAESCFSKVFLSSNVFLLEYDFLLHIPLVKSNDGVSEDFVCTAESIGDCMNDFTDWQYVTRTARNLLVKALGNRVICVHSQSCITQR
jgi:hypothetical protein